MRVVIPDSFRNINIGHQEENEAVEVLFNVEGWAELYGAGGEYLVIHQRPNDPAGYPIEVTCTDDVVTWVLTAADMAYAGYGRAELVYKVNGVVAKSDVYNTLIEKGVNSGETPPDPWTPWVDEVIEARDEAVAAAEAADQSASDAEAAKDAIEAMTASGNVDNTTGTPEVVVTKTIVPGDPEHVNLDFHFSGMKGEPGTGDMEKSAYDPNGSVEQAGGIPNYVAGEIAGKADTATVNAALDLKADKVVDAVAGDFAVLDANGNLADSGISPSDLELVKEVSNDPASSSFDIEIQDAQAAPVLDAVLKGKTAAINQLVGNSYAPRGATTIVVDANNYFTLSDPSWTSGTRGIKFNIPTLTAHKYYARVDCTAKSNMGDPSFIYRDGSDANKGTLLYVSGVETKESITSPSADSQTISAYFTPTSAANSITFRFILVDLTLCGFTASETTDVATLKAAWLKKYGQPLPQYIPYNAGSILSNNATYQLHGKNLFEPVEADKVANSRIAADGSIESMNGWSYYTTYEHITAGDYVASFNKTNTGNYGFMVALYDENQQFLQRLLPIASTTQTGRVSGQFTVGEDAHYFRIAFPTGDSIQIERGTTATDFIPYYDGGAVQADDLNGFDGTDVFDSQTFQEKTTRCKIIDLGTLEWGYESSSMRFYATLSDMVGYALSGRAFTGPTINTKGYEPLFTSGPVDYSVMIAFISSKDKVLFGYKNNAGVVNLDIKDTAYNDAAAFKTAMSGVYFAYELETPVVSSLTPPSLSTQDDYNVLEPVSGDLQSGEVSMTYVKSSWFGKAFAWILDHI